MIHEYDVIIFVHAALKSFFPAFTAAYLHSVTAEDLLCHYQVQMFIIYDQRLQIREKDGSFIPVILKGVGVV